jgi:hypothetical protein
VLTQSILRAQISFDWLNLLACPAGIEPATLGLEVRSGTLFNAFRFLYKPLISNEKAMKQGLTT